MQAHRLSSIAAIDMGAEDHSYREVWLAFSRLSGGLVCLPVQGATSHSIRFSV